MQVRIRDQVNTKINKKKSNKRKKGNLKKTNDYIKQKNSKS